MNERIRDLKSKRKMKNNDDENRNGMKRGKRRKNELMELCQSVRKERYDELSERDNELNENVKNPQKTIAPKSPQSSKNPVPKSDPNCEKVRATTTDSVEKVHAPNPLKPQRLLAPKLVSPESPKLLEIVSEVISTKEITCAPAPKIVPSNGKVPQKLPQSDSEVIVAREIQQDDQKLCVPALKIVPSYENVPQKLSQGVSEKFEEITVAPVLPTLSLKSEAPKLTPKTYVMGVKTTVPAPKTVPSCSRMPQEKVTIAPVKVKVALPKHTFAGRRSQN